MNNKNLRLELKIIRGIDYYTSTIFEIIIEGNESYLIIPLGDTLKNA